MEFKSRKLWFGETRGKATAAVTHALDKWLAMLSRVFPGHGAVEIWADSDPAWTVSDRGDDVLPVLLDSWLQQLPSPLHIRRSPADTHWQNPAENAIKRVMHCATANLFRANMALRLWVDAVECAVAQLNVSLVPRLGMAHAAAAGKPPPPMTREEAYSGRRLPRHAPLKAGDSVASQIDAEPLRSMWQSCSARHHMRLR